MEYSAYIIPLHKLQVYMYIHMYILGIPYIAGIFRGGKISRFAVVFVQATIFVG